MNDERSVITDLHHESFPSTIMSRKLPHIPDKISWGLFALYFIFLALLPSGAVFGINVKILVFLPLLVLGIATLAEQTEALRQLAFAGFVVCVSILWLAPSVVSPYYATLALSQCKDVLSTFIGCLLVRLYTTDPDARVRFIRLCVYTVAVGSLIKVFIFVYCAFTGVLVSDLVDGISAVFGVKLMSMDIDGVGGRLQFPSDNVLPICIFALMSQRKKLRISPWVSFLISILFVVSTIDTFSRYIWMSALIAACLGMLVSQKDKMHWIYIGVAASIVAAFLPYLITLIELRFFSPLATESDLQRTEQILSLKQFFWASPLFGHGMGSFPLTYIRSTEVPYSYEVQILALFGEFGLTGMGLFACLMINYYRKAFSFRSSSLKYQLCVFLMLLDFLAAGFFNPCLLVSLSALSYGLIFALASSTDFHDKSAVDATQITHAHPPVAAEA